MITVLLLLLLGIVLTLVIIAANGYFVAQEFAYMSVDRAALRARADRGDLAARRALDITRRTSFMLSGAQLGITVTGLLIGYVAEPLIGENLGVLLGGVGVPTAVGIAVGTVLALVTATVVQMIFAELYPKNLAIARPEPLALGLARSTRIYLATFGWLITLFDKAAEGVLRLVRVEPVHDVDSSATAEDLVSLIDDSRQSGDLAPELSLLLARVLDFPQQDVEHAMVPRVDVGTVTPERTVAELRTLMASGHTRYPVIGDRDEPVGVAQLIDVLSAPADDPRPVSAIMRPPLVLPTAMSLRDALTALSDARAEMACVIDEYGGFAGVLTVEDLAEELVGEITDEHDDQPAPRARSLDDRVWIVDGEVHVDEVERVIGRRLPRGDYETAAGLAVAVAGRLLEEGERLRVDLPEEGDDLLADEPRRPVLDMEVRRVERHVPAEFRLVLESHAEDEPVAAIAEEHR